MVPLCNFETLEMPELCKICYSPEEEFLRSTHSNVGWAPVGVFQSLRCCSVRCLESPKAGVSKGGVLCVVSGITLAKYLLWHCVS